MKKGLCIICGGHHKLSNSPRNIIFQKPKSKCSACGGLHLGKHYRRSSRLARFGQWCERHGHSEDRCLVKSLACVLCGSARHWYLQCSKYIERTVPIFSPWCELCGFHRVRNDCDDPYKESVHYQYIYIVCGHCQYNIYCNIAHK